ncbi:GNAT family N-acetyltransferase [Rhizobiaceae bacterium n13]|uniref:GNAT family N-acetyltransferase n=1 Tax=Ferirhizobium litorale TaxID=2927786 RepID=A0AAE3U3S0_9HYPH|nr:GNAT family N-acetyltransferase [Fererhizobium litorale]MDI7864533.1 GNAT family N-acetyltransferase [Fererhizobium litorale]MDI7924926.1 GNAT family N-acetyltransferase [Fererhizobium litorale]
MTVEIRLLNECEARAALDDLCHVLSDCVQDGASVGFMSPYTPEDAVTYWSGVIGSVAAQATVLLVAEDEGKIIGTVQVGLAQMPNQPHRGDLKKLLVMRAARGRGLARLLMDAAEHEAAKRGLTLLVLDTATGSLAESIYPKLGWERAGVIPDYALYPDGRYCDTTLFYKRLARIG